MRGAVRRIRQQTDPVRLERVRDPHLRAVDDVIVAILYRFRLNA